MAARKLLIVCGLRREAELVAGPHAIAVSGGGDGASLRSRLAEIEPSTVAAVISFGLAGALDAGVAVGSVVIPTACLDRSGRRFAADPTLAERWRAALNAGQPGILVGTDEPAMSPDAKAALRRAAGSDAIAVDMESHHAGAFAERSGLPFGILRAISDGANDALPPAAARAMRPDGSIDLPGVAASLARNPGQIPALLRTARDAGRAFRTLRRVRGLLGPRLGFDL